MFTSLVFPGTRKLQEVTPKGIREYIIDKKVKLGIWIFEERGIYAHPIREAEIWEREEYFDGMKLPKVTVVPVTRTSTWFGLPLNENQYNRFVKYAIPLPILYCPDNISILDPLDVRVFKHRQTYLLFEDYNTRYDSKLIESSRAKVKELSTYRQHVEVDNLPYPRELRQAIKFVVEANIPPLEKLAKHSLEVVGAELKTLQDLGNGQYEICYNYKGRLDRVIVDDRLFTVDSGICLVDHSTNIAHDRDYDLSSIILVKHGKRRYGDYDDDYEDEW